MRTDRSAAEERRPAWLILLLVGASMLITFVLVGFSYGLMGYVAARAMPAFGLKPGLILAELALTVPGLVLVLLLGTAFALKPAETLGWRPLSAVVMGLTVVGGLTLWVASAGLMELQSSFWSLPPGFVEQFRGLHEQLRPRDALDAAFSVAAIALAPAVCEELLFRGVVLSGWMRAWPRLRPGVAVLVSALAFGLIHVDQVVGPGGAYLTAYRVPFAFSVGLVLGFLRVKTGSLLAPMLAHAVLNTFTLGIAPYFDDPMAKAAPGDWRVGLPLLLAGGLATAGLLRLMGRLARPAEGPAGP